MSRSYVSAALRAVVAEEARYRCGYCLSAEAIVGMPMDVEHIMPEVLGGTTDQGSLWLACPLCNAHKAGRSAGPDMLTGEIARFFNPRHQAWADHFGWSDDGT